jgi:hypothetical protein
MPHSKLGNPETLILDKKKRRIREPDQRSGRYGKEAVHYFQNLLKKVEESSLGKPSNYISKKGQLRGFENVNQGSLVRGDRNGLL